MKENKTIQFFRNLGFQLSVLSYGNEFLIVTFTNH